MKELIHKKQLAKKEVEKLGKSAAELGKNAMSVAGDIGAVAEDTAKKKEIASVLKNTEQLNEIDAKLAALLEKTEEIRNGLSGQYVSGMSCFGKNFMDLPDDAQTLLGTIVNNAKALSASLREGGNSHDQGFFCICNIHDPCLCGQMEYVALGSLPKAAKR